jgi:hypothetical protein
MIPKLEFTAESWSEEYREEVTKAFDKQYTLNGNDDIICHPRNANCHIYAFKGYENHRATLLDYGYADTEAAVEKYLQTYIDEPNESYFVEIGLMSMDYEKYYKNGSYINEDGEDTMMDYWDYWDDSENEPTQEYEGNWVKFAVYILEQKNT